MKPLADLIRPRQLNEVLGQQHILGEKKILDRTFFTEENYCRLGMKQYSFTDVYEKLLNEFANLDFEIYYITLYLENENEYIDRLKRSGKAVFKYAEFKAENSKKQQKIYLEMADEIKEKYPNVNVLNVANDKELEDTKKEIREFIQY